MKKIILTENLLLTKTDTSAGSKGELLVIQNSVGGWLLTIASTDFGDVSVATNPGAKTIISWYKDDVTTYWTSTKITTDTIIASPSQIEDLEILLVDTLSAKIRWTAPQAFEGSENTKADLYFLVISPQPITDEDYDSVKLPIYPKLPGSEENFIVTDLNPGQLYYIKVFAIKNYYGVTRMGLYSNEAVFQTSNIYVNPSIPKRIPIYEDRIHTYNTRIDFADGEYLTNLLKFDKLADQSYVIDNEGVPEGLPPVTPVAKYLTYGNVQPPWYNVGFFKVFFELDGVYDLDYIYCLFQFDTRFVIYTSGDGINLIKAFDKDETPVSMSGNWTKINLSSISKADVKYIVLGFYLGGNVVNGFMPYGTKKSETLITGKKHKNLVSIKPLNKAIGTNTVGGAEEQLNWVAQAGNFLRLYTETDWIMYGIYRDRATEGFSLNPNDIQVCSKMSHMWDWDEVLTTYNENGANDLCITITGMWSFLKYASDNRVDAEDRVVDPSRSKPVDLGLDYRDLAVTTNPQSYKMIARIIGCFAYRWGFNEDAPDLFDQFVENDGLKALGLVRFYEIGNESDRYWDRDNAYTNPEEMAAMLSALYDGHKGSLGVGFGLKSADPNSKLLMPGMLTSNLAYIKAMKIWWDINRGIGNYPIDLINYHEYNSDSETAENPNYVGSGQYLPYAFGLPPEQGYMLEDAQKITDFRDLFMQNVGVAITEFGYDETYRGKYSPPDLEPIDRSRHKALWILRSFMLFQKLGFDHIVQFQYGGTVRFKLDELGPQQIIREKFDSSGYMEGVENGYSRNREPLPSWYYLQAFRAMMQDYAYSHSIIEAGVVKVSELDVFIQYAPTTWAMCFKSVSDPNDKIIVVWNGVGNWFNHQVKLKVSNLLNQVEVTNIYNQDERLDFEPVSSQITVSAESGLKYLYLTNTEFPVVIKTDIVGTPKLFNPEEIQVQSLSSSSIKLAWHDRNIGQNKTRVYSSLSPTTGFTIVEEEYRDSAENTVLGLSENTEYFFKIMFVDGSKVSDVSNAVSVKTRRTITPPLDVIKLSATPTSITLGWCYSAGEQAKVQGFNIYYSTSASGIYMPIGTVDAETREFTHTGLVQNTTYYYKLVSYREDYNSSYSFVAAASTNQSSYEPPTLVSSETNTTGSIITLTFNEEMKDEQTAINAFTIAEMLVGGSVVVHPVTSIVLLTDKSKIVLNYNSPIFKTSTVKLAYSATEGQLKSVGNYAVTTFSDFNVVNNVAVQLDPVIAWTELDGIAISSNTLSAAGFAKGLSGMKLSAGATSILQFSTDANDSIYLGLVPDLLVADDSDMQYYIRKNVNRMYYKTVAGTGNSSTDFTNGLMRYRTNGTTMYLEVSYDAGLTFVTITSMPQPVVDMYLAVYNVGSAKTLNNVVHNGLVPISSLITPAAPSGMIVDDEADEVAFTLNPLYSITQHEFSTNYMSANPTWSTCSSNPILVGDINVPSGGFAIRVKAGTGRNPSVAIVSTVPLIGTINTDSKIMVQLATGGTTLFGTNNIAELDAWLETAVITANIIVQFNTSDTYFFDSIYAPTYNNGTNRVTFRGAEGVRPIFDNQGNSSSVWRCEQDYTTLENLELRNANIEDSAGAIIRADSRHDMKFKNLIVDRGYCFMRATTNTYNFEWDTIIIRNVANGSIRCNGENGGINGNMVVKNIFLDHALGEGGAITGTTEVYHAPLVLKYNKGWVVDNVCAYESDQLFDLGIIEESEDILVKNVRGTLLQFAFNINLRLENCYLPDSEGCYMNEVDGIEIVHSQLTLFIYLCSNFRKLIGSVLKLGVTNTYLKLITDKLAEEHDNVIVANSEGYYIDLGYADSSPRTRVDAGTLASYQATGMGLNSVYVPYADRATVNLNPYGSLRLGSLGKGLVTGVIEGISNDVLGTARTYPTDPGPFSGLRPNENDVPTAPTVVGDNLYRTLSFSHVLGNSEIVVSTDGGITYLPYTGTIDVGLGAVVVGYYKAKIKSASYRDESAVTDSPAFTEAPDLGDYEVLRTMEINFRSDFSSDSAETNINEYHDNASGNYDSLTIYLDLIDKTGASTGVRVTNFERPWDGASTTSAPENVDYIREGSAVESGFSITGSMGNPAKLKFTGLDPEKFYQFYILAATDSSNNEIRYTIGTTSIDKVTSFNYPLISGGDIYVNPAVIKFANVKSDVDGEVVIAFQKIATTYQQTALNYMIIEESNEGKPV